MRKHKGLKKELKLFDVYAIATGTTLSAGFFLLPGIAAAEAGPAMLLAYLVAAVPLIPAMLSVVELATAMPRAGGVYYFLDRSLGPLVGTIGGLGTWLALILKVSFALLGMGAYIGLFVPGLPMVPLAVGLAVALGVLNLFGAKKTGSFQVLLVVLLLASLIIFTGGGLTALHPEHFQGFFDAGTNKILSTAGLVYISYVGVTNVASLSEEVENPERNLPLGIFLALGTAIVIYALGTTVMVGVIPREQLGGNGGDLTPVATAADLFLGTWGKIMVSVAALFAFISVANGGTMSASRYPLAMSRDQIMPHFFQKLSKQGAPVASIILTVGLLVLILVFLDVAKIAKLASAFQLLMFALVCLAVIVMRESQITSYDPGYKSPFYPWMQLFGIVAAIVLIVEMGLLPQLFTLGLVLLGGIWYWNYARKKSIRNGALYHIFERLGQLRYEELDHELRGILKEKGLREEDPFDEIVARSKVVDLEDKAEFEYVAERVADWLSAMVEPSAEEIKEMFMASTHLGATPVTKGVALPHLHLPDIEHPYLVLVRARKGVHIVFSHATHKEGPEEEEIVTSLFFLISPEANPTQHLRILAQIARRVDDDEFTKAWAAAQDDQEL